jgi:hypothetical protein
MAVWLSLSWSVGVEGWDDQWFEWGRVGVNERAESTHILVPRWISRAGEERHEEVLPQQHFPSLIATPSPHSYAWMLQVLDKYVGQQF